MAELDQVRQEIEKLDERLVSLVQDRVEAARRAGELKREEQVGIRDYDVERQVVDRIREGFTDRGLAPEIGERLARILISEALRAQESDGLQPVKGGQGRVLIVGSAGQMGAWLAHFVNGLGYEVIINDVAGPLEGFPFTTDPKSTAESCEIVILATPPAETAEVLRDLEGVDVLVMDVASLKSPIEDELERLAEDQPVTSVHPLWGPGTRVLSDKNVLVCDCGHEEATERAVELFERSAAHVVRFPLARHDEAMALTLGLPHALNLAYADVLAGSAFDYADLAELGGPTFLKQSDVAAEVAGENAELYRQIQALNDESENVYEALHSAVDAIDEYRWAQEAFHDAMRTYDRFFGPHEGVGHP
jgi:chorismate mutase/prephenate dehydrogenase